MSRINRLSKIFFPKYYENHDVKSTKDLASKSQKLFTALGITRNHDGMSTLLPLAIRSLNKLKNLICNEMDKISAQEILLPSLTSLSLFKKTERDKLQQLFKLTDHHEKTYILSPTYEEAVTNLLASEYQISQKVLPLRLYQISSKFRDEMRFRFGLLRTREFIMKDLYCFDESPEEALKTYKIISNSYHSLFQALQVPYVCVKGDVGEIGGNESHEFHFLSDVGEDDLLICNDCNEGRNLSLIENKDEKTCNSCRSNNVVLKKGIEVGHMFNLGERYSAPLNCRFVNVSNKKEYFQMSSFGLGLTRILAAGVEVLSTPLEARWPFAIAPFSVCVIPPKENSKEHKATKNLAEVIYSNLAVHFPNDVVMDDRTSMTIGNRIIDVKRLGFPYVIIVGKKAAVETPKLEVYNINAGTEDVIDVNDAVPYIKNEIEKSQVFPSCKTESRRSATA